MLRNTNRRESEATKGTSRIESSEAISAALHAAPGRHAHHVPVLRANRGRCGGDSGKEWLHDDSQAPLLQSVYDDEFVGSLLITFLPFWKYGCTYVRTYSMDVDDLTFFLMG